jgi:nuclear pore complex protein Nup205
LRKGVTEGISRPGTGHQILPKELVDEVIIISDMYDLNEYMALDLLCTGKLIIFIISEGIAYRLWDTF